MRWTPRGPSRNLEDRRGTRLGGGLRMGLGGAVILLILSLVFGRNFFTLVEGVPAAGTESSGPVASTPAEDTLVQFVSFVLDDAQLTWDSLFAAAGEQYRPATLVLYRDAVRSGCGVAQSAVGPFYCPADGKVYVDLGFYDDLHRRFGAPGDFAQAYVLAHEIGHHVQTLLGTEAAMREAQARDPAGANELSVRFELQADCYAGVWAHSTRDRALLERGDIEEGLAAASAVGDDRIQEMSGVEVRPETFTHGTAAQRAEWFRRGLERGDPGVCETFR